MKIEDNIKKISSINPDYMGFIFYSPSPRNAIGIKSDIIRNLPSQINPVAVFVNSPYKEIIQITSGYGIDTVQLHGEENPEFCAKLKAEGFKIIKAFRVKKNSSDETWSKLTPYENNIDFFLFDTAGKEAGGNGEKFDWSLLNSYNLSVPYFLSGGIGPEDIDKLLCLPERCIGIDINSKFEMSPGIKDPEKLETFIRKFRHE